MSFESSLLSSAETKVHYIGNMVDFETRDCCMCTHTHTHTHTHILYERQSKARHEQMFIYKVAAGRTWQRSLKAGSARVPMNYWYSSCLNVCESGNIPGAHYKHPRQTKSQNLTPTFPLKCGPVQHEERITTGYEKSTLFMFCLTRGRLQKWKTAQQGKQKSTTIKMKSKNQYVFRVL